MRSLVKKTFFVGLVFSLSGVAQTIEQYPIPAEVLKFYNNLNSDHKTNCANTDLFVDNLYGPNLSLGFYDNGIAALPSWRDSYFSSLKLYGKRFTTTYKITKKNDSEILDIVSYEDACIPRFPFGNGCRPAGVWRYLIQIVKDASTGWVQSASLKKARNGLNIFGNLKGNWSDSGLYQYSCKDGVLTVDIDN